MAKVVFRDRLTLIVGEMSRPKALEVSKTVNALIDLESDSSTAISDEFHFAYVDNAPVKAMFDGKLLSNGTHELEFGDDTIGFKLTLPITRDCFDNELPVSLAAAWIEAAETENKWLSDHFLSAMKLTLPMLFEPESASTPS